MHSGQSSDEEQLAAALSVAQETQPSAPKVQKAKLPQCTVKLNLQTKHEGPAHKGAKLLLTPQNQEELDFLEPFQPKAMNVEKPFVRINYLKQKSISMAQIQAESIQKERLIKQELREKQAKKQKLLNVLRGNHQYQQKQTNTTNNNTELTAGKDKDQQSRHSSQNQRRQQNSEIVFSNKTHKIGFRSNTSVSAQRKVSSSSKKKLNNSSSSSCCSCCKSSQYSSIERANSRILSSSIQHSISYRGLSEKSRKILESGNKLSASLQLLDISSGWAHKSAALSSSGQNKTGEVLQKKLQKIIQVKQEKQQIKQLKEAEKAVRDSLKGLFSIQAREEKQRKKQEEEMYEQIQKQIAIHTDPAQVERVDALIQQSIDTYNKNKIEEKKQQKKEKNERKIQQDKLQQYEKDIRVKNREESLKHRDLSASQNKDRSVSKDQQHAWGVDQRKYEEKVQVKEKKIFVKEKIDLKALFSEKEGGRVETETVKKEKKKVQHNDKKNSDQAQTKGRAGRQTSESTEKKQRRQTLSKEQHEAIMAERLKKIKEEMRLKALNIRKEIKDKKQKLDSLENARKESLSKAKKVPFIPTPQQIELAFLEPKEEEDDEVTKDGGKENNRNQDEEDKTISAPNEEKQKKVTKINSALKQVKKEIEEQSSKTKDNNNKKTINKPLSAGSSSKPKVLKENNLQNK